MNISAYAAHHTSPSMPSPFNDATASQTTINPIFKYNTQFTRVMPGCEFDPRSFCECMPNESPVVSYSTQSLDRRATKIKYSNSFKDEVILRPIVQQPFEYLDRPGSITDLRFDPNQRYRTAMHYEYMERNSSTHSLRDVAL